MADQSLAISFRVGTDGLVEGLRLATRGVDGAAQEMRQSLRLVGDGAKDAAPHVDGLSDKLKEYRTHVRTEARYTQFLAGQVAGLGIASKGAAAEFTGLISAFAFGGGVAVAVELVKMLAHFFTEAAAEEKKFKEEIKAFGVEAAKSVGAATREVDKLIMSMRGASAAEMFFFDKVGPELEKQFKLEQKLIKANQTLSKAREDAKYATQSEEELNAATEKERKAVEKLTAALKAKRAEIEGLRSQERRVGTADDTKKGQELSDEEEHEEEQHQ